MIVVILRNLAIALLGLLLASIFQAPDSQFWYGVFISAIIFGLAETL